MHVVAAGVHGPVVRLKVQAALLSPRQGIHVRPQQDAPARVFPGDGGHQAAAQGLRLIAQLFQFPGNIGRRAGQFLTHLRAAVDGPAVG